MLINKEILLTIQQAIDIEAKYSYTNINGKYHKFAEFIKKQLYAIYKDSKKDAKWLALIDCFEKYEIDSLSGRKHSIEILVKALKSSVTLSTSFKSSATGFVSKSILFIRIAKFANDLKFNSLDLMSITYLCLVSMLIFSPLKKYILFFANSKYLKFLIKANR